MTPTSPAPSSGKRSLVGPKAPALRFELVDLSGLRAHEEIDEASLRDLVRALREEGSVREPILVAEGHGVVLNGHHRFAALKAMGLRRAPAWVVDYFSDVVELDQWPDSPFRGDVTKEEVVRRAKEGRLYPPKTTRHRLRITPESRSTPIEALR